ncbi:MAG: hypothetical protein IH599_00090, partial [Bacteroidales bacterium]|nr:hypothetical protein [Bacteroidales bacterium]
MNRTIRLIGAFLAAWIMINLSTPLRAQEKVTMLSLDDVVRMSRERSPDAMAARHRFRSSYWSFQA